MKRMRRLWLILLVAACASAYAAPSGLVVQVPKGGFVTLCFHDVVPTEAAAKKRLYSISTEKLAQWFDWMHKNQWHPVSVQQIIDAHNGGPALPDNAVLLSFDDGLESTYSQVYPLLKAYHYPALFALETGWLRRVHGGPVISGIDEPASPAQLADEAAGAVSENLDEPGKVDYNGTELGPEGFVNWAQVREMQASGLVEFATHTDSLHHGMLSNPQGNQEPAAVTRMYHPATHDYESNEMFRRRIRDDLKRSLDIITKHTGVRPRVVVWPYGATTGETLDIAHALGLKVSFSLIDKHASSVQHIGNLGRFLIMGDPGPIDIVSQLAESLAPLPKIQRAVQVDLDDIYDPDPKQENRNLGKLLDRILKMHVRTVYLQAFADPDGDGTASALYFPNRFLPMRADLFNRVAWQLKTRAQVVVYAWLPLLAYDLPDKTQQQRLDVKQFGPDGQPEPATGDYRRLSPFQPQSLRIVKGIYADLARNLSSVNGVLIHDDATLHADEDATSCLPQARWPGTDRAIENCRLSARQKTLALIDFGQAVTDHMRYYTNLSNPFHVARNLYARVVMDPSAENRFAQALGPFLKHYDEVALMAMPYLDGTKEKPSVWLDQLAEKVAEHPDGLRKTVFELQTRDWNRKQWIPGVKLRGWMQELVRDGALNLAYYPDDFLAGKPPYKPTFTGISLNDYPHGEGGR